MKEWNYENEQWTQLPAHLKHLPLFTRHIDFFSVCMRYLWSILLKNIIFKSYIRLSVKGTPFKTLYREQKKLIIISNHASHLDAVSIAASIPRRYWLNLYIAAAKDYFFTNFLFTFFSKHCLGAIPIDRKDKKGEAIGLILKMLNELPRMWLIIFPEGTRSKDGKVQPFKRGVSIFSERTNTPLLFTYLEGNSQLWPKGQLIPKPGKLVLHVGPVYPPGPINEVYTAYRDWVSNTIGPHVFAENPRLEAKEKENGDSKPEA